jgi:hypothetical protein
MATMNSQTESHHALWQESRQGSRDLKKKRRRDRRAPPDAARSFVRPDMVTFWPCPSLTQARPHKLSSSKFNGRCPENDAYS